tara:strand:+ start:2255 stop:2416 length:162 start_codon:yes stop_codon:yes gene_type:complete
MESLNEYTEIMEKFMKSKSKEDAVPIDIDNVETEIKQKKKPKKTEKQIFYVGK